MYIYIYIYTSLSLSIYIYVYIKKMCYKIIYIYVCININIYIYIYIYIHTFFELATILLTGITIIATILNSRYIILMGATPYGEICGDSKMLRQS